MNKRYLFGALLLASALGVSAQTQMKAPSGGKQISDQLIGIFFEDINNSADGGLNAQLVQNGSFEYSPSDHDGWGPGTAWRTIRPGHSLGFLEAKQQQPLHPNNPNYMRLNIERVGHYYDYTGWTGFGIQNDGFDAMTIKAGDKYDFSFFARNVEGDDKPVRIVIAEPTGWGKDPNVLGEATVTVSGNQWKQYSATITATKDCNTAVLQILALKTGVMDVDQVSLMPQDTYHGHGIRKDLAETLEAIRPRFMRFPGGCVVHGGGDGFWNTYRWKNTVGPKHQRKQLKNTWGYHQSMEIGYHEYFQLCEDMGMEPLPILPCGVSCQGTNGGWGMKNQAQDTIAMAQMDEWVEEALDLIEWANGGVDTKWGKVRAEAGHPAPFNLKYLGIGNEERISPEFEERFKYIYERVTKAHPEIIIVGTAGPGSHKGNPDYDNGWRIAEELAMPILDEHYYEPREYFQKSRQYDSYPRDSKTKVYLGEYAAKDKKLIDALSEALYLLHIERNGDVVCMTSYAPLLARKNGTQWNPDLIYYDNSRVYPTCSYYVQKMFGESAGNYYYGNCVTIDNPDKSEGEGLLQEQSVVLNTKTRELFVKICNATANTKTAKVNLSRFSGMKPLATQVTLSGQPEDENNFDSQPIAPVTTQIKVKKNMTLELAPYSFIMIKIQCK